MTVIAPTGHRPDKLGGYDDRTFERLTMLAEGYLSAKPYIDRVYSGMALGWDQAVCQAAIRLGFKVVAAVPFQGQSDNWPPAAQQRYDRLLSLCAQVIFISEGEYTSNKMKKRNIWMVDSADEVLALYDGSKFGGTYHAVEYAKRQHKPITNLWDQWQAMKVMAT
jgi:uncharacterized phage-like protein YoqJ